MAGKTSVKQTTRVTVNVNAPPPKPPRRTRKHKPRRAPAFASGEPPRRYMTMAAGSAGNILVRDGVPVALGEELRASRAEGVAQLRFEVGLRESIERHLKRLEEHFAADRQEAPPPEPETRGQLLKAMDAAVESPAPPIHPPEPPTPHRGDDALEPYSGAQPPMRHSTAPQPSTCDICGDEFRSKNQLKIHKQNYHPAGPAQGSPARAAQRRGAGV